jgi:hypothetical protein
MAPKSPEDKSLQTVIDGGTVGVDIDTRKNIEVGEPEDQKHKRNVTLWLVLLLAVVIVEHEVVLAVLEWNGKKVDSVNSAFNAVLPVVSGLVGSAVTYYFTHRGK